MSLRPGATPLRLARVGASGYYLRASCPARMDATCLVWACSAWCFLVYKAERKRLMLCFLLSQRSICSHPQQACWLRDICQDFFFFLLVVFLNSQESSRHRSWRGTSALRSQPLGGKNGHLQAHCLPSLSWRVDMSQGWISCSHAQRPGTRNLSAVISVPTCAKMAASKMLFETS